MGPHGPGEVALVAEAEVGGEDAEVRLSGRQALQGPADPDPVAVMSEGYPQLAGEPTAQPVRRDPEQLGQREQAAGRRMVSRDRLAGRGGQRGIPRPAVQRSREVLTAVLHDEGLDATARFTRGDGRAASVREMLLDMIEEYARHTGHADLLRESVDGLVGENAPQEFRL
jgi:hypothetical protein